MRSAGVFAWVAALLAIAAAAASRLKVAEAIPPALACLAAIAAIIAGVRQGSRKGATPDFVVLAPPAALPQPTAREEPSSSRQREEERAREEARAAELATARAMAVSALRRLRFADSVLAKVPVKTEEAAFALMERLVALRDQSAGAADSATSAGASSAESSAVAALAESARQSIARVRTALSEMHRHDKEAAKGFKALGQELSSGIELLAGIEEITERSRLIAFNMAVEAARIGEKGRGFRVIVGELRALNDRTAEFSKRVAELLGRFSKYNETLIATSISSSTIVGEEVERSIGEEEKTIESLLAASTACAALSADVLRSVKAMNIELDGILESLQFQDITRQMVEGALTTISEAEEDMLPLGRADGSPAAREEESRRTEELRAALLARAKTKGEKEAIQEVKHEVPYR